MVNNEKAIVDFALELESLLGGISGTVTSASTGEPIPGALIELYSADGIKFSTLTDANGNYSFLNIAPGFYSIVAGALNYLSDVKSVTVLSQVIVNIDFQLKTRRRPHHSNRGASIEGFGPQIMIPGIIPPIVPPMIPPIIPIAEVPIQVPPPPANPLIPSAERADTLIQEESGGCSMINSSGQYTNNILLILFALLIRHAGRRKKQLLAKE